jgi:hypothetical protein
VCLLDIPLATTLTDLPIELIGEIAVNVRYPTSDGIWEDAEAFLLDYYTSFTSRRKDISALSQTCSFVRKPVERILYQDVHLDFSGWHKLCAREDSNDSGDPENDSDDMWCGSSPKDWPGSLPLLLRTLDQRPDLRIYVRSALLGWFGEHISSISPMDLSRKHGAMIQLFERCPRLQRLAIPDLPPIEVIAKLSAAQITTLACRYHPFRVPAMVEKLPLLRNLHCVDSERWNHPSSPPSTVPRHNLTILELHGEGNDEMAFFIQALELCTVSVQELRITYRKDKATIGIAVPCLNPNVGKSIVTLRIKGLCASKGLCILNRTGSEIGQIFHNLPALQHLHLTHHLPLTPESFTPLPRGLRSLTLSNCGIAGWGDRYTRDDYIRALVYCLQSPAGRSRNIIKIIAVGVEDANSNILGDLQPLRQFCDTQKISFLQEGGGPNYYYNAAIKIICELMTILIHEKILTYTLQLGDKCRSFLVF